MPSFEIDVVQIVRGMGQNDADRARRIEALTGVRLSTRTVERIGAGQIPKTARALLTLVQSAKFGGQPEYTTEQNDIATELHRVG